MARELEFGTTSESRGKKLFFILRSSGSNILSLQKKTVNVAQHARKKPGTGAK
jgi:hypothetical protein